MATTIDSGNAKNSKTTPRRKTGILSQLDTETTSYYLIAGATGLLLLVGLIMVLSSSSVESFARNKSLYSIFLNQARYAAAGLVLLFIAMRVPIKVWKSLAWPSVLIAAVLQGLVFTPLGVPVNGNLNWIEFAGQRFQPSEAMKLALVIWLGFVLARKQRQLTQWSHVIIPIVPVVGASIGLVMAGGDLGTALVLTMLVAGALFVAGVPLRMFAAGGVVAGIAVAVLASSETRKAKIFSWLSSECDTGGACYQVQQGHLGLASGGWFGRGLGASRSKWSFLPEAQNDFIYAVIGEELGILGTTLILVLFTVLFIGLTRVIRRHPDPFVKITTAGVAAWLIGQALLNIAVVLGLAPVIGVPLPLVSAGGSALVITLAALGMVMAFARSEPGAAEALAARPSVIRRSLGIIGLRKRKANHD